VRNDFLPISLMMVSQTALSPTPSPPILILGDTQGRARAQPNTPKSNLPILKSGVRGEGRSVSWNMHLLKSETRQHARGAIQIGWEPVSHLFVPGMDPIRTSPAWTNQEKPTNTFACIIVWHHDTSSWCIMMIHHDAS